MDGASIAAGMGLFTKVVAESDVAFSGIQEYADDESGEKVVAATAEVVQKRQLGGKEPLPMFGPLGAVRLLSMLRREQQYVIPFMVLVAGVADELEDEGFDPAGFSVRGCATTDREVLVAAGTDLPTIALNCSLPVLQNRLPGPSERTTALELHEARNGMASVRYKFSAKASNALTTIGAWAATVDYLVPRSPKQEMALPVARGLRGLGMVWDNLGNPMGISISEGAEIEALLTDVVARNTPD
jgi:hypothetical protein